MKKILALATALVLGAGLAVSQPAPAKADGGVITGLIIGGIAGHVITRKHDRYFDRHYDRYRRHHYSSRGSRHDAWCHRRYKSYDSYSNTWVTYGGDVRQCRSPYRR